MVFFKGYIVLGLDIGTRKRLEVSAGISYRLNKRTSVGYYKGIKAYNNLFNE